MLKDGGTTLLDFLIEITAHFLFELSVPKWDKQTKGSFPTPAQSKCKIVKIVECQHEI